MPQQLPDEIVGEILLRLPPDEPACFLRASLVHKRWRRILASTAFRRRLRELHPMPRVLGFFRVVRETVPYESEFVPIDQAPLHRRADLDFLGWLVLDCRHGRALFVAPSFPAPAYPAGVVEVTLDFLVWDPLTREHRLLPPPSPRPTDRMGFAATVLCAAGATGGCDHRGCHGGPFLVVFVWTLRDAGTRGRVTSARVYSSEAGGWGDPTSFQHPGAWVLSGGSNLVGDRLYFETGHSSLLSSCAFEYQLGAHRLSLIELPKHGGEIIPPISAGDGELCYIQMLGEEDNYDTTELHLLSSEVEIPTRLGLWSREADPGGAAARWARRRVIDVASLFPGGALPSQWLPPHRRCSLRLIGFVEGTDAIIVRTRDGRADNLVHMLHLNSGTATATVVSRGYNVGFPHTGFCIPVTDAAYTDELPGEGVSSARQTPLANVF